MALEPLKQASASRLNEGFFFLVLGPPKKTLKLSEIGADDEISNYSQLALSTMHFKQGSAFKMLISAEATHMI